jgi:hypothetical protein
MYLVNISTKSTGIITIIISSTSMSHIFEFYVNGRIIVLLSNELLKKK